MDYFAGLDVSLETANICIVDADGDILSEKKVEAEPAAIIAGLKQFGQAFKRIGLEAGPTSSWLYSELHRSGYPAICLECRHVKAGLSAMRNKTDRNDARGIAQLVRLGWFRQVHVKSEEAQRVRMLLVNRQQLLTKALDLENSVRGSLKVFGLRVGTVGRPDKVDDALAAGWDVVLPRTGLDAEKLRGEAGGGVGVVLDPLGTAMLELDLAVTDPGGRIALFGNPGGGTPGPLPPLGRLIGGNVGIAGFSISKLVAAAPDRAAAALARVLGLVAEGRLAPQVTVVDGLAGAAEVHDLLAAGRGAGKYVVAVRR